MTNFNLGTLKMNKKICFYICGLCLFFTVGCAGSIMEPGRMVPEGVPCEDDAVFEAKETQSDNREFVNYSEVAANYREHGERAPRDEMITQGSAGTSLSASVPPVVDGEVIDYQEELASNENISSSDDGIGGFSPEDPVEDWLAEEGRTLKELLAEWSDRSGWRLVWKTNRNYTLNAGAMFRGRFADVSAALIRAFGRARPAPIGTFYKGNRVLVVETLEDENAYD